jgi:hypothetical protein
MKICSIHSHVVGGHLEMLAGDNPSPPPSPPPPPPPSSPPQPSLPQSVPKSSPPSPQLPTPDGGDDADFDVVVLPDESDDEEDVNFLCLECGYVGEPQQCPYGRADCPALFCPSCLEGRECECEPAEEDV